MLAFPEREYNMTDAELGLMVGQKAFYMERDEAEFTARGVTALDRQAFEAEGDVFEEILPDDYYRGRVTSAVMAKNDRKDELEVLVQSVSGYVQQGFGLRSGEYTSLKVKGYAKMTEAGKLKAARTVASVAENLLADLASTGLTQAMIDDLRTKAQEFEDGMDLIAEREGVRENAARDRIVAGNSVYKLMVKYCEIGKLIWENLNPAYYNDYIIYPTVHHELSKVQNVSAAGGSPGTVVVSFDPVAGALQYEVQWSAVPTGQPQGSFDEQEFTPGSPFTGPINPGFTNFYRVRGVNPDQTGAWSDVVSYDG